MNPKTTPDVPTRGRPGASTTDARPVNPDAPQTYSPDPLGKNSVQGNNYSGQPVEQTVPPEVHDANGDTENAAVAEGEKAPQVDKTKSKK